MIKKIAVGALLSLTTTAYVHALSIPPNSTQSIHQNTKPAVDVSMYAYLVQNNRLLPLNTNSQATQGDQIEYHIYVKNTAPYRIRTVPIRITLAQNTAFSGSISPKPVLASIDRQNFGYVPLQSVDNGQYTPVDESLYQALHWDVEDIAIDGTAILKFRTIVN